MTDPTPASPDAEPLALWGGVECTHNRVRERYFRQLERSGHLDRAGDLERFAALGIRALRYPVLWEQIAPDGPARADWSWPDARLPILRALGVDPIVGLVHHGSGPRHTHLLDPGFATGLAEFAGAVAERYPWVQAWTPVNEPLTTARFSALYGIWYPHATDDRSFVAALLNQCRATVLAMRAIRRVNASARLIQTEDLGKTYGTEPLAGAVGFYNERRWLSWDLLCGRVDPGHALWTYLTASGATPQALHWFTENPCPPDVIGANFYVTGERWLDHRVGGYPERFRGRIDGRPVVDIETARALATPTPGLGPLLEEAWDRYRLPIAVTESHIDAHREDQLRWTLQTWRAAQQARSRGVDVRAVTLWALLGSFDWNCLVQDCRGYYEPGAYDVRAPLPRPTALARLARNLAAGREPDHPVLQAEGWWRRPDRFFCKPVPSPEVVIPLHLHRPPLAPGHAAPILVTGASGTLGRAFARLCAQRNLAVRLTGRDELDIADPASVTAALERHRPWAVINACGYVRIDDAEHDVGRCRRENTTGPAVLAAACASRGIGLVTFSSDQVFGGDADRPWLESDPVRPLNAYGRSKADAEHAVRDAHPGALIVRTGAFFGPWDRHNFVGHALDALAGGGGFDAADDARVSPTYVPDLVHATLCLLVDGESGVIHLANEGDVSWHDLAARAAAIAGIDATGLRSCPGAALGQTAPRPAYAVLASERVGVMRPLEAALRSFVAERDVVEARPASATAAVGGSR